MLPRLSRLTTRRLKDVSASSTASDLLAATGYVSYPSSGLAILHPLGLRVQRKIENIIRSELDSIGCAEVAMSNISNPELWRKTGRIDNAELFRVNDGSEDCPILAPTHEEEITHLMSERISSPKDLPLLWYQIGRKYRNEARPRGGLLRGKEFMMKDLYSFDVDEGRALESYSHVRKAYDQIFEKLGIPVKSVAADSGAIGGSHSHEYHVVDKSGEDTLVSCSSCDYAANIEVAERTPGKSETTCTEVNGVLVTHEKSHAVNPRLVDRALLSYGEDAYKISEFSDGAAHNLTTPVEGDSCPSCSSPLEFSNAIEVGHTFYLGTKYSGPLSCDFKNSENKLTPAFMGCYGIGITRLVAAIAEVSRDKDGLKWPSSVAPFETVVILGGGANEATLQEKADQTVYTLAKAGDAQFAKFMAVYLDHVINPTLRDSSHLTEVYHVTPKAREAGVVFSEMQAHAHSADSLMENVTQKKCFPEDSAYRSETGGMLDPLRVLTNDSIKEFHKSMYAPDNMVLVVAGQIDESALFRELDKFEKECFPGTHRPFRPFVDTEPEVTIPKSETVSVEFPDEDEEFGKVQVSWIGPDHDDGLINTALDVLGAYLTESGAALLQKELVDIPDPLAVSVMFYTRDYLKTSFSLELESVPTKIIADVPKKMLELIAKHTVDLGRVKDCLENTKLTLLKRSEENAEFLCTTVIEHFLYGRGSLEDDFKMKDHLDTLATWTSAQWTATMVSLFVSNNHVTVLGKPSAELAASIPKEAKQHKKELAKKFGKEGLEQQQKLLDEAEKEQSRPIPMDVIDEFKISDPKIAFLKSHTERFGRWAGEEGALSIHYEKFDSNFVNIDICLGAQGIDEELLPLIHLIYGSEIFNFPVEGLTAEEVMTGLNHDTVQYYAYASYKGFNEVVQVHVEAESSKYEKVVEWMRKCLLETVWDTDRIQVCIDKAINQLPETKRDAESRLTSAKQRYLFENSLVHVENLASYEQWLRSLDINNVVGQLEKLKKQWLKKDIFVAVTGNVVGDRVSAPWKSFFAGLQDTSSLLALPRSYQHLSKLGETLDAESVLVPMSSTKTAHLNLMGHLDMTYTSAEHIALLVACEYFQCVEGPFWTGLRGKGYVYGSSLGPFIEAKRLQFEIYRSSNVYTALCEARSIVLNTTTLDETLFVGAKRSVINNFANSRASNAAAASSKVVDVEVKFRSEWTHVDDIPNFVEQFVQNVEAVTEEEVKSVIQKYILPLFQGAKNTTVFCALNIGEVDTLKEKLEKEGYNVQVEEIDEGESGSEDGSDEDDDSDHSDGSDDEDDSDDDSESDDNSSDEE
ncbi:putative proline--tRNA ligase [Yarrowia sp. B02]|nr:putative proline--tRNA ligase [Yarrowia sp. B02]